MTGTTNDTIVYIVDDDDSVRKALVRLMQVSGHTARPFVSAESFLDEVRNEPSGCILLDITMPNLSGPKVRNVCNRKAFRCR